MKDLPVDPLQPHSHEPNPNPPSADASFTLDLPDGTSRRITIEELHQLPRARLTNCYIISTGHGTAGPFTFVGVTLLDLLRHYLTLDTIWQTAEVVSADGFGNRVQRTELLQPHPTGPILLSYRLNNQPLTRQAGLVRLIVPQEKDDALRQVKWVGHITLK